MPVLQRIVITLFPKTYQHFCFKLQLETARLRVFPGRVVQHGAATHAAVSWFPGNFAHAAAVLAGPPHARHAGLLLAFDEASCHLLLS